MLRPRTFLLGAFFCFFGQEECYRPGNVLEQLIKMPFQDTPSHSVSVALRNDVDNNDVVHPGPSPLHTVPLFQRMISGKNNMLRLAELPLKCIESRCSDAQAATAVQCLAFATPFKCAEVRLLFQGGWGRGYLSLSSI